MYASRSLLPGAWADRAIDDIVSASRARNAELDVTGALLFTGGWFAQFIEGSADAVAELRDSIGRDRRHADVKTLRSDRLSERIFDGWSLAYAGPSLFVTRQVNAALQQTPHSADRLVRLLSEFAVSANG
jgi:hypothetical protein